MRRVFRPFFVSSERADLCPIGARETHELSGTTYPLITIDPTGHFKPSTPVVSPVLSSEVWNYREGAGDGGHPDGRSPRPSHGHPHRFNTPGPSSQREATFNRWLAFAKMHTKTRQLRGSLSISKASRWMSGVSLDRGSVVLDLTICRLPQAESGYIDLASAKDSYAFRIGH